MYSNCFVFIVVCVSLYSIVNSKNGAHGNVCSADGTAYGADQATTDGTAYDTAAYDTAADGTAYGTDQATTDGTAQATADGTAYGNGSAQWQ